MLSDRRRQLGLSIAQASRVLKLKEQVLIAFEEGDWDRIPRSGYAQGMLSSYARYLGLNPRDVIDQFQTDLQLYTSGQDRYKDPYDTGVGAPHVRTSQGYPTPNSGYGKDKDLYGSAGPAGSILTGHELGQPRRTTRSIPLASTRNAGYSERYLRQQQSNEREAAALANSQYPQGRPYTARAPQRSSDRTAATRRSYERAGMHASGNHAGQDITTRRVTSSDYDDDLTYSQASPYEQANSREGRRASRNIAAAERPNVRRRGSESTRRDMQRRTTRQQKTGVAGVIEAYFSNRTRTIVTIFAALAIVIILVLVFSVRACNSSAVADEAKASVAVSAGSSTSTDTSSSSSSTTTDKTQDTTASTTTAKEDDTSPVTVTVTVGSGEVSWLEITNGDKSLVADTVSGPWEQTYTVDGEMTIEASDITAVTVLKNGTQVPFDERASGVGSIIIEGPKATADAADEADAEAEDVSAQSDDASDSTSSSSTKSNTSSASGTTSKSTATSNQ
jgi:hypothetical protein